MHVRKGLIGAGLSAWLLAGFWGTAQATSTCQTPTTSINLADVSLGDSFCTADGKLEFSEFSFHSPGGEVSPAELELTILDDGILFSAVGDGLTAQGGESLVFNVSYTAVATDPGMAITGMSLEQDSWADAEKLAGVLIGKRVFAAKPKHFDEFLWKLWKHHQGWKNDENWPEGAEDWARDEGGEPGRDEEGIAASWGRHNRFHHPIGRIATLRTLEIELGDWCEQKAGEWGDHCDFSKLLSEVDFVREQDRVRVVETVVLKTFRDGDTATFYGATNRFSIVPEPGTAALMALGLAGLGAGRRRRMARAAPGQAG